MNKLFIPISLLLLSFSVRNTHAVDYFVMDFENGKKPAVSQGSPVWSLPPAFDKNYGPGNFFEVTDVSSHTGTYSLRFTYEARNNFCNTCGVYKFDHQKGLDGVDYVVADSGENLTLNENSSTKKANDGPAAKPGRILYNRTRGYSRWEILTVENKNATNDKLTVKLLNPGINGEASEFTGKDEIQITRQCGIDGHIGLNIDRRSDCDNIINWLTMIEPQIPGTSIFRRQYLKAEISSPKIHQKLHYFKPDDGGPNAHSIILVADSRKEGNPSLQPQSGGLRHFGGDIIYKPGFNGFPEDFKFERSVWYYIEEEYKSATQDLATDPTGNTYNTDGAYRLWISKSGLEDTEGSTPILEVTNLTMPVLAGGAGTHVSFWGNVQHMVHAHGSWYIDDIQISDSKIGKAAGGGANIAPPSTPTLNK